MIRSRHREVRNVLRAKKNATERGKKKAMR